MLVLINNIIMKIILHGIENRYQ